MQREDIEKRLTWDTSLIYKNDDEFYKEIEESKKIADDLTNYKDKMLIHF